jgi:glucan phosphoethanolaminetransferase (alkaline phosphatase superfamily)
MSLPHTQGQPPAVTLQDLEDAIALSETLQKEIEKLQKSNMLFVLRAVLMGLLMTALYVIAYIQIRSDELNALFFFMVLVTVASMIRFISLQTRKNQEKINNEKKAINRVFSLIHESKDLVYLTQPVGLLKRAELEVRLSRLTSYAPRASSARVAREPSPAPIADPTHAR